MILAAGLGQRMRPLTLHTPKPLLPVANKPLIVWHIEKLKQAGITEIIINTAWLAEELHTALGNGEKFGVHIFWSNEVEGLETAGGIIRALPLLGNDPFLLVNGDIWTAYDFSCLTSVTLGSMLGHLVFVDNPTQHPEGDFILHQSRAYTKEEHMHLGESLTYSGIAILSPKLFANYSEGKRPLAPILKQAMQQGLISAEKTHQMWVDVGTPERLAALDDELSDKFNDFAK